MTETSVPERKEIERLIAEDQETEEALLKTMQLLRQLNNSGILDLLLVLTDRDVFQRIVSIAASTGVFRIADRLDELPTRLSQLLDALEEPAEPIGVYSLLQALQDPEVAKGLARIIKILKIIGSW